MREMPLTVDDSPRSLSSTTRLSMSCGSMQRKDVDSHAQAGQHGYEHQHAAEDGDRVRLT
jgi:hypothetical protein